MSAGTVRPVYSGIAGASFHPQHCFQMEGGAWQHMELDCDPGFKMELFLKKKKTAALNFIQNIAPYCLFPHKVRCQVFNILEFNAKCIIYEGDDKNIAVDAFFQSNFLGWQLLM